ncbi:MAG TPA: PAS domain S-box protein [Candidatus Binatia bacterium]
MGRFYLSLIRHFGSGIIYALCAIVCLIVTSDVYAAEAERAKRVLLISTGNRFSPGFALADQAVLEALAKIPSGRIETYGENLDILQFPPERFARIFKEYLTEKYAEKRPDLVILIYVGNVAIAGKLLQELFPGTPVVVAGFTEEDIPPDQFGSVVSGIAQRVDPRTSIELILRLQPETRRIVVIGGTAEVDRHVIERVKETARSFAGRVDFDFWDNRSLAELRQAVSALPPQTAILFGRMFRDGAGQPLISSQAGRAIAESANAPVYIMTDPALGTGAVGGAVASVEAFGNRAGELARLILTGTPPASLRFEIRTDTVPLFDWRALKRWGISESRLPPYSIVRFRPQSTWEQYRWYIIGALIIIGIQSALIVDLLLQRRRRRRIQEELRESQQLMELATNAGELGLWSRDIEKGEVWVNPHLRTLFGFAQDEPLRLNDLLVYIHPDDRTRVAYDIESAQLAGIPFEGEFRILPAGGRERWVVGRGKTVSEARGMRRMGVILDITERKRAEEMFRLAVEASPTAIAMINWQGEIVLVNTLTERLFGYSREELIGRSVEILVPERLRADFPAYQAAFSGAPQARAVDVRRDLFARRKDGSEFLVEIGLNPIHTPEGPLVLTTIVDITEQKRMELDLQRHREELAHVTRVSTVGELTTSVAHELNQPLGAILSNAEAAEMFLTADPPALDEVRDILADIRKDDQRASEVIRRIRNLMRKQKLVPKSIEINEAVEEVLRLLSIDASARKVAMKFEGTPGLRRAWCDPVHFQQVVLNLILNGMEAMAELPEGERQVVVRTGPGDNGTIKIAVVDSGPGIPLDTVPKLFEPFFTTKKEGMGMGLSIARTIVEAHHGQIWAENNSEIGATFYFTVPVDKGESVEGRVSSEPVTDTRNLKSFPR